MAVAGQLTCEVIRAYTGKVRCGVDFSAPRALILFPKGTQLDAAELAALQATLDAGFHEDDYTDRFLLISNIVGIEDNSDDPQRFSNPDGSQVVTRNTVYRWRFKHQEGWCYHKNIMELDGAQSEYDFAIVDVKNIIWLSSVINDDGEFQYAQGFTASLFELEPMRPGTFTDAAGYYFTLEVTDTAQLNENGTFLKTNFSVNTMSTIIGVSTGNLGSANWTTGVFNISLTAGCGAGAGVNLATQFGTELAATGAWVVTNGTSGAAITVTTVTAMANGSGWTLDVDSADSDYPTSGSPLHIRLANPSALSALGVEWYEGSTLVLIRPA